MFHFKQRWRQTSKRKLFHFATLSWSSLCRYTKSQQHKCVLMRRPASVYLWFLVHPAAVPQRPEQRIDLGPESPFREDKHQVIGPECVSTSWFSSAADEVIYFLRPEGRSYVISPSINCSGYSCEVMIMVQCESAFQMPLLFWELQIRIHLLPCGKKWQFKAFETSLLSFNCI